MRRRKKLNKILFEDPKNRLILSNIKDFDKVEEIYWYLYNHRYFTMHNKIVEYGDFTFFKDFLVYLREAHRRKSYIYETYEHCVETYFKIHDTYL